MKRNLLIWLLIFLVILFFYRNIFNSYFEGDEWYYFSIFLPLTHHPFGFIEAIALSFTKSSAISGGGHVAPLYNLVWFLENLFFGLHFKLYVLTSLLIHTTNSFLLFKFTDKVINRRVALLSAVIFAISAVHYEAITWVMAVVPTQISLFFILCGYITFTSWVSKPKKSYLVLTIILFLSALFTKETAISAVLVSPVLIFFVKNRLRKGILIPLITLLVYLPVRFIVPLINDGMFLNNIHIPLQKLIWYQFLLFERISVEAFVPSNLLLIISKYLSENIFFKTVTPIINSSLHQLFVETLGADILIFILSPLFSLLSFVVVRGFLKKKKYYEVLLFSLLIIVFSAVPLLFILSYAPWWIDGAFIDSRHLYFPSIGVSILLAYGLLNSKSLFPRKTPNILKISIIGILFLCWSTYQYFIIQQQINKFVDFGTVRLNILERIRAQVPLLSEKTIFTVESDTGYYGFATIPPFQTSLGQILAIIYFKKNEIPEQFLNGSKFMTKGLLDQGTATYDGITMGYYSQIGTMLKDLSSGIFGVEDVRYFKWNGARSELTNETENFQKVTKEFLDHKKKVADWNTMEIPRLHIKYPPDTRIQYYFALKPVLQEFELNIPGIEEKVLFKIVEKDRSITFGSYIQGLLASDNIPIGNDNLLKNITREDGSVVTTVYINRGDLVRYFLPFSDATGYLEISAPAVSKEKDMSPYINKDIELLLFATRGN